MSFHCFSINPEKPAKPTFDRYQAHWDKQSTAIIPTRQGWPFRTLWELASRGISGLLFFMLPSSFHGDFNLWCGAVRDRPEELLSMLIMLIMTDFAGLRGGTGAFNNRYGQCYFNVEKAFIV